MKKTFIKLLFVSFFTSGLACINGSFAQQSETSHVNECAYWLTYSTEFSDQSDDILVIDAEHTLLKLELSDLKTYSHYKYVITNDKTSIDITMPMQTTKEINIDLCDAIELPVFKKQNLNVSLAFSNKTTTKNITIDIDYHYVAISPIPFVSVHATDIPVDRTRIDAEFYFYDIPMANGWYSIEGPYTKSVGTIHARGQGSLGFPKKSFALNLGKENPISFMGMPESHKWVMIGNWIDISHLANKVSYDLYAEMNHYGPQSQFVQVLINDTYWGLYTFTEKIQRGINHVNTKSKSKGGFIVKEVDNNPDFVTTSGRTFDYEYPDKEDITVEQEVAIQEKIDRYEKNVIDSSDWRQYINEDAEIDYFIITDVFANPDSYYQDKNLFYFLNQEDKLEPVIWDFIWAFGPPYYTCKGNNPWCYIYSPVGAEFCSVQFCSPNRGFSPSEELMYGNDKYGNSTGYNRFHLMKYYMQDAQNVEKFKSRYKNWRSGVNGFAPILSDGWIKRRVDELIFTLKSGGVYERDKLRWEGEDNYNYGFRYSADDFKTKILERLKFMDDKVPKIKVEE